MAIVLCESGPEGPPKRQRRTTHAQTPMRECSCGGALRKLPDGSHVQGILFLTRQGYLFILKNGIASEQLAQETECLRQHERFFEQRRTPFKVIQQLEGTKEELMTYIRSLNAQFRAENNEGG